MYTAKDLEKGFREIGIQEGDVLLVHSSYRSLGELEGGAKTFFEVLLKVLGERGTLILPSFTYSTVTKENPYFHYEKSKSVVGYLSEYFRTCVAGVKRSKHITHSCCVIGPHTEYLINGHEKDQTMVGGNSPLRKLPKLNGKILFLGCGTSCNSSMHGVEVTMNPPYLFYNEQPSEYIYDDGKTQEKRMLTRFTFGSTGTKQRYFRLTDLLDENEIKSGKICAAGSYLVSAKAVWEKGQQKMKENPYFFVDSPLDKNSAKRLTIRNFKKDKLQVEIYANRTLMGEAAARDIKEKIKELLAKKQEINMIFAAAPSQNDVLKSLVDDKEIEWNRVNAYHMDEYIGLDKNAPQGFGNFLKEHIFGLVPFKSVNYIDIATKNPEQEAERYGKLLQENPTDIVIMGIGENGHIAFNDPPVADFKDEKWVKPVKLDEICRQQQVNDGCFASLDKVPTHAMTLTVPTLIKAPYLFCIVPAPTKANAVYETLNGSIDEHCPASILRTQDNAKLYLDNESSKLL